MKEKVLFNEVKLYTDEEVKFIIRGQILCRCQFAEGRSLQDSETIIWSGSDKIAVIAHPRFHSYRVPTSSVSQFQEFGYGENIY